MRFLSQRTAAASACVAIALLSAKTAVTPMVVAASDSCGNGGNGDGDDGGSCSAEGESGIVVVADADEPPTEPEPARRRRRHDGAVSVTFHNRSPHRADVHYDDGRFGHVVGTLEAGDGALPLSSFVGHEFFVTKHGVRNGLVDPATDEQYRFVVGTEGEEEEEGAIFVLPETAAPSVTRCKDRYPVCRKEAERGECKRNPGWMIVNCCQSCDDAEGYGPLIDGELRCDPRRLNSTIPAWEAGDLDRLFERWATDDEFRKYQPRVVASPGGAHGAERGDGPWVMTFDSFLSDYEVDQLILGAEQDGGFERSTDQGRAVGGSGETQKVTSRTRTSSNAWCRSRCESLPGVQSVTKRIEEVTGIPSNNYESFQILQYQEGQFYRRHHDSSDRNKKAAGHRILTFFLYLNDVEEGGETRFTTLDISIAPKKGRALVWPSVLNNDPESADSRMYHEAKEVLRGTKYAANHWIHQYDFRNANLWGCNGSFS